jgi:hypothetical protein
MLTSAIALCLILIVVNHHSMAYSFRNILKSFASLRTNVKLYNTNVNKMITGENKKDVLALDFDGVVCASSGESSVSSIRATRHVWQIPPKDCPSNLEAMIQKIVNDVRPIVETGFENMLLVRYIYESYDESNASYQDKMTKFILSNWNAALRDELIQKYGSSKNELVDIFGAARDKMIKENITHWVGLNTIYPGVQRAMTVCCSQDDEANEDECEFSGIAKDEMFKTFGDLTCDKISAIANDDLFKKLFIVTTKQGRFVREILESNNIFIINKNGEPNSARSVHDYSSSLAANSNIFDLDNVYGSKINVLLELTKRLEGAKNIIDLSEDEAEAQCAVDAITCEDVLGVDLPEDRATIHFVEDRYETLVGVIKHNEANDNELGHVKLYLADWGYNTQEQRKHAAEINSDKIRIITEGDFKDLVHSVLLLD